jgi:hypothetical protein
MIWVCHKCASGCLGSGLASAASMISHKAIQELRELEGLSWITALKSTQIRSLVEGETLQLGLFDERTHAAAASRL